MKLKAGFVKANKKCRFTKPNPKWKLGKRFECLIRDERWQRVKTRWARMMEMTSKPDWNSESERTRNQKFKNRISTLPYITIQLIQYSFTPTWWGGERWEVWRAWSCVLMKQVFSFISYNIIRRRLHRSFTVKLFSLPQGDSSKTTGASSSSSSSS